MLRVFGMSALLICVAVARAGAAELIMVERPGCVWCARWNAEIAPAYPKTSEGNFAPLRRERLRRPPGDVSYARRVTFTPTFILAEDGAELARIEGYPGEDFFWPLLDRMLAQYAGFVPEP